MKKLLVLLAVLALAAPAAAGLDPGTNGIGVYFDVEGNSNCASPAPYAPLNMYLLATNINEPSGVSGWEAHVYFNPTPGAGVTYSYMGTGALNVLTAPDFQVGIGGGALPYAPAINLLTMNTFYLGGQLLIGVGEIITKATSFPVTHKPGFAAGNDPSRLVGLTPSSNVPWPGAAPFLAYVVAGVNAGINCPVPNAESSWGNVKALYQ